ncbi:hypothetical protein CsSME_00045524 [Camellia sinensis var. sinensis]
MAKDETRGQPCAWCPRLPFYIKGGNCSGFRGTKNRSKERGRNIGSKEERVSTTKEVPSKCCTELSATLLWEPPLEFVRATS